jgi:hypothetical protein
VDAALGRDVRGAATLLPAGAATLTTASSVANRHSRLQGEMTSTRGFVRNPRAVWIGISVQFPPEYPEVSRSRRALCPSFSRDRRPFYRSRLECGGDDGSCHPGRGVQTGRVETLHSGRRLAAVCRMEEDRWRQVQESCCAARSVARCQAAGAGLAPAGRHQGVRHMANSLSSCCITCGIYIV